MTDHERFMRVALEEAALAAAEGNMGCGAVITQGGAVVSRAHNQATTLADVTAHAETQAVRRLSLDRRVVNPTFRADAGPLKGTTLYRPVTRLLPEHPIPGRPRKTSSYSRSFWFVGLGPSWVS